MNIFVGQSAEWILVRLDNFFDQKFIKHRANACSLEKPRKQRSCEQGEILFCLHHCLARVLSEYFCWAIDSYSFG